MKQAHSTSKVEFVRSAPWDSGTLAARGARGRQHLGWLTTPDHLVKLARECNAGAISSLCRRYGSSVRNYLWRRSGRCDQADDATQETFIKLMMPRAFDQLDPEESFRSWLKGYAWNQLRSIWNFEKAKKRRLDEQAKAELLGQAEEHRHVAAERVIDQQRTLDAIERVWALLRADYERIGKGPLFEHLKATLLAEESARADAHDEAPSGDRALCQRWGYLEAEVANQRHKLKTREFPAAMRALLAESPSQKSVAEHLREMIDALS